ncbi:MAG: YvcK family protein [bacterium]|nr:YvcK family protein [bacterium]
MPNTKITVIGGGTGTIAVLQKLKDYPHLDISVIVSMTDDGGSNAVIRDEFGLLPLSDLRKSIIALSEIEDGVLREMFTYRFNKGEGLSGHTLGNLMMTALTHITGSEVQAIAAAKTLFRVKGEVIPVTLQNTKLVALYEDGNIVLGEHLIDEPHECSNPCRIQELKLSKNVVANPEAIKALREADVIIAGPGDLYTTTLANVIIPGISQAIVENAGTFIFINNLMTKFGQTSGMKASDLVSEITKYAHRAPDVVFVHEGILPQKSVEKYAEAKEFPIEDDLVSTAAYKVVRSNFIKDIEEAKETGDKLRRSLIRHDSEKLSKALYAVIQASILTTAK